MSFLEQADIDKVYLVEAKVGKEVEGETWTIPDDYDRRYGNFKYGDGTKYGDTTLYSCSFDDGEVVAVKENGSGYTEVASYVVCDTTASSFYFDYVNQLLYVHTSAGDSPDTQSNGSYIYTLVGYFWVCITNRQNEDEIIDYVPQDASYPVYYLPYLDIRSLPSINQAVGEYYDGSVRTQYGSLSFLNDGWWYDALKNYLWHNKEIEMKIGAKGSAYSTFETVFVGKIRNPSVSDDSAILDVKDSRMGEFKEIPVNRFWIADYANLESGAEGQVIPVLFGDVSGITPTCIDTTAFTYKIADHALQAIDAVYQDSTTLVLNTDYTVDLANGEFMLLFDPDNSLITCDAQGVKCNYDTGLYSANVADFLYYVLNTLNGIAASDIDTGTGSSFDDLKVNRTDVMAWYLNTPMATLDFIQVLQVSALFQFVPMPNGKYGAFRYATGTDASTPTLWSEDYDNLEIEYKTDRIFKQVVIKYGKNPSTGAWLSVSDSESKVGYRYDEEETLTVETLLTDKNEAEALAYFYLSLVKTEGKRIRGIIPAVGIKLKPTDKLIISKTIIDGNNGSMSVFDSEVYRILELTKNLNDAKVEILAIEDVQATGQYHTNFIDAISDSVSLGDSVTISMLPQLVTINTSDSITLGENVRLELFCINTSDSINVSDASSVQLA